MRLWEGVLVSSWLWGGASTEKSRSLSKILDLASHKAFVTGEWYIPGHKLRGFFWSSQVSNGEVKVETTGIAFEGQLLESIFLSGRPCSWTPNLLLVGGLQIHEFLTSRRWTRYLVHRHLSDNKICEALELKLYAGLWEAQDINGYGWPVDWAGLYNRCIKFLECAWYQLQLANLSKKKKNK